jgi:hypothetical protein
LIAPSEVFVDVDEDGTLQVLKYLACDAQNQPRETRKAQQVGG